MATNYTNKHEYVCSMYLPRKREITRVIASKVSLRSPSGEFKSIAQLLVFLFRVSCKFVSFVATFVVFSLWSILVVKGSLVVLRCEVLGDKKSISSYHGKAKETTARQHLSENPDGRDLLVYPRSTTLSSPEHTALPWRHDL